MQVILVRPWRSASIGGGCCSAGPDSVALEQEPVAHHGAAESPMHGPGFDSHPGSPSGADHVCQRPMDPVAQTYRLLRSKLPAVDIQMTTADNTWFLLPATYRAARRRHGRWEAVRRATRSTTAGAVIIDGEVAGHVEAMGPEAVLEKVLAATA